jgi:1-phosphofructokinase family hexose kinase
MITTVTLNPAVDRTFILPTWRTKRFNRVEGATTTPGGRGINASYALQVLGAETLAMAFVGGMSGRFIEEKLQQFKISTNFIHIDGETRTNYIILNNRNALQAQINEKGPRIAGEELTEFKESYQRMLSNSEMIIVGGSLPRGVTPSIYTWLITAAKEKGIPTYLSTSGEALSCGIEAQPLVAQPDIRASDRLMGVRINTDGRRIEAAQKILDKGIELVVMNISVGRVIAVTPNKVWEISAPSAKVVNAVGIGDALVGGVAYVLRNGGTMLEAAKLGTATSVASALQIEAKAKSREQIEQILENLEVKELGSID